MNHQIGHIVNGLFFAMESLVKGCGMMIGCLCLHGFTGSPWEVEPIVTKLKQEQGWLVYTPYLPGHEPNRHLHETSYKAWIYKADLAAKELFKYCEKVHVVGFSMGGILACYVAARYPINRLVLLGAAAYYLNLPQMLKDAVEVTNTGLKGELRNHPWYPIFSEKKPTSVKALAQFMKAIQTIRPYARDVKGPVFIGQGLKEGLVPFYSAKYLSHS